MNGKLIVLEGLDGSGKTTQFEKIDKLLYAKSIDHKAISFPDYDQPSSELVRMYLAGEILLLHRAFMLLTDMSASKNSGKRIITTANLYLQQDM